MVTINILNFRPSYYRGSVGALLVYDITKHDTFEGKKKSKTRFCTDLLLLDIPRWLGEIKLNDAHPELRIMLIGNKSDLAEKRAVSQEEAKKYAESNGLMFMETSALDSSNVDVAFQTLVRNIFDKLSQQMMTTGDKQAKLMRGEAISLSHTDSSQLNEKDKNRCAC